MQMMIGNAADTSAMPNAAATPDATNCTTSYINIKKIKNRASRTALITEALICRPGFIGEPVERFVIDLTTRR